MKIVLFNGSPKKNGTTARALNEVADAAVAAGAEAQIIHLQQKDSDAVYGCTACLACRKREQGCKYTEDVCNELVAAMAQSDGIVLGSPVYFASANGAMCSVLDRAFYSSFNHFVGKPGASVAVCRRGGASATFDRLNKYFTFAQMPLVSSQYWNMVHGTNAQQAESDHEGLQTMRTLGRNMVQLIRAIEAGRVTGIEQPAPSPEDRLFTNFIR